jgi:hypothetical protein
MGDGRGLAIWALIFIAAVVALSGFNLDAAARDIGGAIINIGFGAGLIWGGYAIWQAISSRKPAPPPQERPPRDPS